MSRHAWVCERCLSIVRYPDDRVVVSRDYMRPDGRKRYRRIELARMCRSCMEADLESRGA